MPCSAHGVLMSLTILFMWPLAPVACVAPACVVAAGMLVPNLTCCPSCSCLLTTPGTHHPQQTPPQQQDPPAPPHHCWPRSGGWSNRPACTSKATKQCIMVCDHGRYAVHRLGCQLYRLASVCPDMMSSAASCTVSFRQTCLMSLLVLLCAAVLCLQAQC